MGNLTGWHALIILAVVLLIFGAAKLPALAKSVGQSVKILKKEVQHSNFPDAAATSAGPLPSESSDPARASLIPESGSVGAQALRRD